MLEVRNLSVSYGQHQALDAVSLEIQPGEIVAILGANGAGKSTLLRAIAGICEGTHSGEVAMQGHPILGLPPNKIVERGVALVPEGRGIFGDLTVAENLGLGAYCDRARSDETANLDRVLSLFPALAARKNQIARTMSGGEQQMVAIGRAMMSSPQFLMLDEPSLGLAPVLCKELFASLEHVRDAGIGVLLVEQNAKQSLAIANRGYLLENARIVHEDTGERLLGDPAVQKAYLGAGASTVMQQAEPAMEPEQPVGPTPNEIAALALETLGDGAPAAQSIEIQTPGADRVPAPPIVSGSPPPRRSADELAGISIDEIVQRAAQQSGHGVRTPDTSPVPARQADTRKPPTAPAPAKQYARPLPGPLFKQDLNHDDRLKAVLDEIESAAKSARNRARSRNR